MGFKVRCFMRSVALQRCSGFFVYLALSKPTVAGPPIDSLLEFKIRKPTNKIGYGSLRGGLIPSRRFGV